MKKRFCLLFLALIAISAFAAPLLRQDFEDSSGNGSTLGGKWDGFGGADYRIVSGVSAFGAQTALEISRVTPGARLIGTGLTEFADDRDTVARIKVRPGATDKCFFEFELRNSVENKVVASVHYIQENIMGVVAAGKSNFLGRSLPEQWQTLELTVHPGSDKLEAWVIREDGGRNECLAAPLENCLPFNQIVFYNRPGTEGAQAVVDSVELFQPDCRSVHSRENVALSANDTTMSVTSHDGQGVKASRLNDGDNSVGSVQVLYGFPSVAEIEFPEARTVSSVRLHSGIAEQLNYPSCDMSLTACKIEGFSTASGGWRELAIAESGAPVAKEADDDDTKRVWQLDFDPIEVRRMRITFLDSNDTGKRASAGEVTRGVVMREIEVFGKDFGVGTVGLATVLQAEYRLQVYRDQEVANIHAILAENTTPFEVELSFRERWTGRIPRDAFRVMLQPGENIIPVDIRGWENGEYRTQLRAAGKDAPVKGEFGRLLRIDRLPKLEAPEMFGDLTGERMFFPDDWYLAEHNGIEFKQFRPEVHYLDLPRIHGPNCFVKLGSTLYLTKDGELVVSFQEMDQYWKNVGDMNYAACKPGEWKWRLLDGKPEDIAAENNAELCSSGCRYVGSNLPGWSAGNGNGNYRFYDAEKDGPVDLSQVVVQYAGYKPLDWGVVKVPPQSTWLLWNKGDEVLLLWDHFFLQDNISGDEFEELTNTNDNFAGQWLSKDGKTLYYVRGHLVKRYPPFIARYDNLWQASRLLTVFFTHDGINWNRHYYALPDETDPPNSQHYGSALYWAPKGNGLLIGFMEPYLAMNQQYASELTWSWDGMHWKRFPGHESWIPNGKPDEQDFGLINLHNNIVEKDGVVYHEIGFAEPAPHFAYELLYTEHFGKITGEMMRKTFEGRGLHKDWPHFKYYGSWDKLAESWNRVTSSCGVAAYRKNGIFGAVAGPDGGSFITRPVNASGKMTANLRVLPGGSAKFTLLEMDGTPIEAREVAGDNVDMAIFDALPSGRPFRVKAELISAELFTLNFD